jgi:hypothetical protein
MWAPVCRKEDADALRQMPLLLSRRQMHCTEEHRAIDRIAHHPLEEAGFEPLLGRRTVFIGTALNFSIFTGLTKSAWNHIHSSERKPASAANSPCVGIKVS